MNRELYELSYSMKKEFDKKVFKIVSFILIIFVSINLILNFLIFPVRQVSVSMSPNIEENSCILFSPLKMSKSRGSVVLVQSRNPENRSFWETALDLFTGFFTGHQFYFTEREGLMGDRNQIRRIIGIPGDTVKINGYVVQIKPAGEKHFLTEFELIDDSYKLTYTAAPAGWDDSIGAAREMKEFTLGEDEYFLLGDNRNSAIDSRLWGPVKSSQIIAGACVQFLPFSQFKFF